MTAREFAYWLQGFFELGDKVPVLPTSGGLNSEQVECIKKHLALVFKHEIDPSAGSAAHQKELNKIHTGSDKGDPYFNPIMRC